MADFDQALQRTLGHEGGYSDHKDDSGGKTRYGITEAVARSAGYRGEMRDLPLDLAKAIYRERYWNPILGDEIPDQRVANELFDTGVNLHPRHAVRFLQVALNARNVGGTLYPDVAEDGLMGPGTLAALRAYLSSPKAWAARGLLAGMNCEQGHYYHGLRFSTEHETQRHESFMDGWFRTRIRIED